MGTFPDHFHRCMRHPHQPIVGVCASCLRERLAALHQPRREDKRPDSRSVESSFPVPSQGRSARPPHVDYSSSKLAGLVIHDKPVVQVQNLKLKSDAPSPDRNHKDLSTPSPRSHERNTSLPSRISNASESDRSSKTDADLQRKKRTSLWSLFHQHEEGREPRSSRGKSTGQPNLTMQGSEDAGPSSSAGSHGVRDSQDRRRLEQLTSAMRSPGFSAGRKSREFAVGSTNARQTYLADLGVVVETTEQSESTPSWISSLFQRRKPRSKTVSVSKSSFVETGSACNGMMESSRSSLDAGRLSLDGARLNIRQILKTQEARSRQAQLERSPIALEYAKRCNVETDKKAAHLADQLSSSQLHKRKSVISNPSARSSISVDIPSDFQAVEEPPSLEDVGNEKSSKVEERPRNYGGMRGATGGRSMEETDQDERQFSRSRSWGRAWSKTLSSPLWSFKHHNRRDPSSHELPSSTPNHTQIALEASTSRKDSSSSAFGFYSPLRRIRHAAAGGSMHFPH